MGAVKLHRRHKVRAEPCRCCRHGLIFHDIQLLQRLPGVSQPCRRQAELPLPGLVRHGRQGYIARRLAGLDHCVDRSFRDRPLLADLLLGVGEAVVQGVEQIQGMGRDSGLDRPAVVRAVRGAGCGDQPPVQLVQFVHD